MGKDLDDVVVGIDSADNAFFSDVIGNKSDTVGGNSIVSLAKQILSYVGGEASQLRIEKSVSGNAEESGIVNFSISIYDIDAGQIALANIDITAISAVMYKSTGGGAFSSAGITQPTFTKANGLVTCDYTFVTAEWMNGDIYKLVVSGISVTVGADTAYVNAAVWSSPLYEIENIQTAIETIDGFQDVPGADSANNAQIRDVVGNKTDTIAGNSIIALAKQLIGQIGDFAGQTNLQTLLDSLGIPDVAGKNLYTCLITDRLDDATNGLANLKALIDAIQIDLGNYSGQTNLQSLLAALGIPDTAGKPLYTCLITDRLDNATYGLSMLATKAILEPTITSATFSYLDAGGTQDIVEVVNTKKVLVKGIAVDCNTLTQNGTLDFWTKIDGTNYRKIKSVAFTVASDDSVMLDINIEVDDDFKFTWTEGGDEGAARDLPYKLSYEIRN